MTRYDDPDLSAWEDDYGDGPQASLARAAAAAAEDARQALSLQILRDVFPGLTWHLTGGTSRSAGSYRSILAEPGFTIQLDVLERPSFRDLDRDARDLRDRLLRTIVRETSPPSDPEPP